MSEIIEQIFYRKINPSDFKKLYDIDRPLTGGGQTYLEAAGIQNDILIDFLSYGELEDCPNDEDGRMTFKINAYVLGDIRNRHDFLTFSPRNKRANYRICRQSMKDKHPAWNEENGFPLPERDRKGQFLSGDFKNIIDNLIIIILRTSYRKYYAGFLNYEMMPDLWPNNIGLDSIFLDERRGVIDLSNYNISFSNDKINPFGSVVDSQHIVKQSSEQHSAKNKFLSSNIILYGVPGSGKSWTIKQEYCKSSTIKKHIVFHPEYTYSDFVGQILPVLEENEKITYKYTAGPFTEIMKDAWADPEHEHLLIIEEINRGNAPAIFADIFQLLDRKREISTQNDDGYPIGTSEYGINNAEIAKIVFNDPNHEIRIPPNLSIIATMNTSDQNVFTLDTAFQRRWNMRLVKNNFDNVKISFSNHQIFDTGITWKDFCTTINSVILDSNINNSSSEDKRLGPYFINENDLEYEIYYDEIDDEEIEREVPSPVFPEKVLKYLWDDAFKYSRENIFDIEHYNSLEKIIDTFLKSKGFNRFLIFSDTILELLKSVKTNPEN